MFLSWRRLPNHGDIPTRGMIKLEVLVMHLTHVGLRILFIHEWKGIKIFDPILIKLVDWSAFFRLFQVIQNEVKF
jgi:hypothetical protein